MKAAVFLDRDNTVIHNDGDLGDPEQVRLIKGAASAIASLRGLGYKIVVVSNQGGVARGKFTEQDVEQVNQRIGDLVKATTGAIIDRFYYCPYHPQGKIKKYRKEHPWRKPQPGMLLQAAEDLQLDLSHSWVVGDQLRDVQAGLAVDVRAILLHQEDSSDSSDDQQGDGDAPTPSDYWVSPNLIEAVKIIAQQRHAESSLAPEAPENQPADTPRPKQAPKKDRHKRAKAKPSVTTQVETAPPPSSPTKVRPFRPWMTQPADDDAHEAPEPIDQDADSNPRGDVSEEQVEVPTPAVEPPAPIQPDDHGAKTSTGPGTVPIDQTLRQILQELRNQRAVDGDFSYQDTIAIVLQMLAAVCLLGALWMGSGNLDLFVRWIAVGLAIQLATIAMLMFRRR